MANKYYVTDVDTQPNTIYCHHDLMGELLIPQHTHSKAQFLYTEGGIVHVKTQQHTYFLPARHYMWIPAGVQHSIHTNSELATMRNLYFPVLKNDVPFYFNEGIYPANDLVFSLLLHTKEWNGNLEKGSSRYTVASAFKILLAETSGKSLELALPMAHDKRLAKILDYLHKNLHKNLLFADVAAQFGFSTRTLHRLFIKDLDMSFIKYFTICRMLRAIELLLQKEMQISEIAAAVGYSSVPTFSNTFYKILGRRPTEYSAGRDIL